MGFIPSTCPLHSGPILWLTLAHRLGSLRTTLRICKPASKAAHAPRKRIIQGRLRRTKHERPTTPSGNLRLLPPDRLAEIHLRPPRRQRRQARRAAAQRRPHHHRHARPHPRLHGGNPAAGRAAGDHRTRARAAPAARRPLDHADDAGSSPATRSAISASSTTGRNICCSSTPAARNGRSRTASPRNSRISIRARRRCACSMPASATARC